MAEVDPAIPPSSPPVPRHRTALSRTALSRPLRLVAADGLMPPGTTVMDYGCGLGDDVRHLQSIGIDCVGWDPAHAARGERRRSDVVNLGYVLNVIENELDRRAALRDSWTLAGRLLVVSARLKDEAPTRADVERWGDGILTRIGTFQKFYDQQELRAWIDATLDEACVAASPGVFYVFRDIRDRTSFLSSRFRRRVAAPRVIDDAAIASRHGTELNALAGFLAERGRPPSGAEFEPHDALVRAFGSLDRACRLADGGSGIWERARKDCTQDLLVHLALSRFDRRPAFRDLPLGMRLDVKAFFGSHANALAKADAALFSLGDPANLDQACRSAPFGKLMVEAIYVLAEAIDSLPTALRIYEGCARSYVGAVEGANVVKLGRAEPKVSYLAYPDFEVDPHPALSASVSVDLRTFKIRTRSYARSENPPILHRKEEFVPADHPLLAKFARLTKSEVAHGLYENPAIIGTRGGWARTLAERGLELRGHRLINTVRR